jgi:hypothetical protein
MIICIETSEAEAGRIPGWLRIHGWNGALMPILQNNMRKAQMIHPR